MAASPPPFSDLLRGAVETISAGRPMVGSATGTRVRPARCKNVVPECRATLRRFLQIFSTSFAATILWLAAGRRDGGKGTAQALGNGCGASGMRGSQNALGLVELALAEKQPA